MSTPNPSVLRRLNGRLQACDPCRSRKVACDHTRPVCLRCRKRKQDRFCVYTISSTTIESSQSGSVPASSSSSSSSTTGTAAAATTTTTTTTTVAQAEGQDTSITNYGPNFTSPSTDRSPLANSPSNVRGHVSRASGYLGFTSYCTVIEETLSILNGQPEDVSKMPCTEDCPVHVSSKTLALAVTILRHIPYPEDGERLFIRESGAYDRWLRRISWRILKSLYSEWGRYLGRNRSVAKLEEMARKVCVNTAKAVNKIEGPAWLDQFTGPNLRWESIGLVFNYWDLFEHRRAPEGLDNRTHHHKYSPTTQEALLLCHELAQEFSDGNPFIIYLSFRRTVIESLISGDASRQTWRYLADTVASLTFLGMHAEAPNESQQPTLYTEVSRRILLPIFTVDKVQLAFTGRPPLLFRKFITTPMPLDLNDEDLFLDQEEFLEKVRTTLDEKGWNLDKRFHSGTWIRARYMIAEIREQIAEIALGNESRATVEELLQIKERQNVAESEFPPLLFWRQEDITNYDIDSSTLFSRLLLKLDSLQNEFFLYRLLIRKGQPDEGCLLATSFEMVTMILNLWTHMDRFTRMRPDFEWLVMSYGASPGGILCKCLLKAKSSQIHPSEPAITRSAVIQKLSLLVGFLDWVSPTAPNAELCKDALLVIQRVLDQALNNPPGESSYSLDGANWDFPGQLDWNFDLMDTFDWIRSD